MDQNELVISDIESEDYDLTRKQLARRRRLAEELLNTPTNRGVQAGHAFAASGADPGAFLSRAAGMINQRGIDSEEAALSQRERQAQDAILSSIPASGPERQAAQMRAMTQIPSLRDAIKLQMAGDRATSEAEARKAEKEANAIARREDLAIRLGSEAEMKREGWQAQKDLRQIPTVHVTNSGGGGSNDLDRQIKEERLRQMKEGKPVVAKPLTQKDRDLQRGFLNLDSALTTYDKLLDSYDMQGRAAISPTQRAALETAFTDVQMGMKSLYELGAPQAGDMKLLEQSFRNPTSIEGSLRGATFGKDQYKAKVKQLRTLLGTAKANFEAQTGKETPEAAVAPTEKKRIKFSELP